MLKRKVNYKRSEFPTFVDKVKELTKEQQEVERAVIDRGKYKLKYQYRYQSRSTREQMVCDDFTTEEHSPVQVAVCSTSYN